MNGKSSFRTELTVCNMIKNTMFDIPFDIDNSISWNDVYEEMLIQAIAGLPYNDLLKFPFEDEIIKYKWLAYCIKQQNHYTRLLEIQSEVISFLDYKGIKSVVIKGTTAAENYPIPKHRSMGDIDLLVNHKDFRKSIQVLVQKGLKIVSRPIDYDIAFIRQGITIELHRRLSNNVKTKSNELLYKLLYDGINSRQKKQLDGFVYYELPTLCNGLVLLLHIVQHITIGLGFRHIIDWMMFVNSYLDDNTWERSFQPIIKKIGYEELAKVITRMCQMYLGLSDRITWCKNTNEKLCKELFGYIVEHGNFGYKTNHSDDAIRFFSSVSSPIFAIKRLQQGGLARWKLAHSSRLCRAFAWLYQICYQVKHKRYYCFKNHKSLIINAKKRKSFFYRIGIK